MIVYIIIAVIAIVAAIIIYGAVSRKKIYKEVDKLEHWKTKIANEPVAEEVAKVKGLTMSGETEEKFEEWRKEWEDILGDHLPHIEEILFDIEEWANKYRFKKSKELIKNVEHQLQDIDSHIQNLYGEVEELIHSEEENRIGIAEIKDQFESLERLISQNASLMGRTASIFEKRMKNFEELFVAFHEETELGNYLKANQVLKELKDELDQEAKKINMVPALLIEIETDLPEELLEIEKGMKEMEEEGYPIEQFEFSKQLYEFREELPSLSKAVSNMELEKVKDRLEEIKDFVEHIYDTLESEVQSRIFVEDNVFAVKEELERLEQLLDQLEEEREQVRQSYRIPEDEWERQDKVEDHMEESLQQWRVFRNMYENRKLSFTGLKKKLESLQKEVRSLDKEINRSKEKLYTLRKDELKALESLKALRRTLLQDQLRLQRSMLPKVPSKLLEEINAAEEKLEEARKFLEEVPVEMGRVNASAEDANHYVTKVHQQLRATMEQADLAERAIQYGNKYRSRSLPIDEALLEAENYFRDGYYDEAVNTALQAIEQKEPNARERIVESFQ